MCCQYAEAVIVAQKMMRQNPELGWVYMVDDDSYIRADALQQALMSQPRTYPRDRGLVLANYACATTQCSNLLCGGSGYAANRWAIDALASEDPKGFVQDIFRGCIRCGGDVDGKKVAWGDAGLTEVVTDRGIEQRTLDGIYAWMLDKSCFEHSLEYGQEPLLYHMVRTQSQMEFLHRLFTPMLNQPSNNLQNAAPDGLGGCIEFQGNVQCAASRAAEDRPWHHGSSQCMQPHMPRMRVLIGLLSLFVFFAGVVTFILAGFRGQKDGFKIKGMEGMKWHSFPMLGNSRVR